MIPYENIVMNAAEQAAFNHLFSTVDEARTLLEQVMAGAPDSPEDLRVACARLDNWLSENAGRWVK
jgi:hypothetical protein